MAKSILTPSFKNKVNKACVKIDAKSPEIYVALGITGVVIGTIAACVASTKVSKIISDTKEERSKIIEMEDCVATTIEKENPILDTVEARYCANDIILTENAVKNVKKNCGKELTKLYTRCGAKILSLYAPALCFEVTGIIAILSSYNILNKRNVAISASYTALNTLFKEYRNRVAERFGDDVEKEIRYNIHKEIVETTVIDEDGNEQIVSEEIEVSDKTASEFGRWFDAASSEYVKDAFANRTFLTQAENYANMKLRTQGYLFINEVYEMLGIPRLYPMGNCVGWIYNPDNKDHKGDNYVSFGMYDRNRRPDMPDNSGFINGYEREVFLDFNVDGVIINDIK